MVQLREANVLRELFFRREGSPAHQARPLAAVAFGQRAQHSTSATTTSGVVVRLEAEQVDRSKVRA